MGTYGLRALSLRRAQKPEKPTNEIYLVMAQNVLAIKLLCFWSSVLDLQLV